MNRDTALVGLLLAGFLALCLVVGAVGGMAGHAFAPPCCTQAKPHCCCCKCDQCDCNGCADGKCKPVAKPKKGTGAVE